MSILHLNIFINLKMNSGGRNAQQKASCQTQAKAQTEQSCTASPVISWVGP
jgi:hypothetical protein